MISLCPTRAPVADLFSTAYWSVMLERPLTTAVVPSPKRKTGRDLPAGFHGPVRTAPGYLLPVQPLPAGFFFVLSLSGVVFCPLPPFFLSVAFPVVAGDFCPCCVAAPPAPPFPVQPLFPALSAAWATPRPAPAIRPATPRPASSFLSSLVSTCASFVSDP